MSPKPRPRAIPQPDPAPTTGDLGGLVARTPAMLAVVDRAKKAATAGLTTILLGETGTGKSVLARRMHVWSGRTGAFVEVNCANLNGNLAESELFGHTRGAFTGADRAKQGRFKEARGGTLFLDEVGELPLEVQAKLLTAVDSGVIRPVGSDKADHADVYLIVATHRDLKAMVAAGTFREDLYYRLLGSVLTLPPLRERTSEIAELLEGIFARHPRLDGQPWRLGDGALVVLHGHRWPGNVRELAQLAHRAVATLPGPVIEADAVRELFTSDEAPLPPRGSACSTGGHPFRSVTPSGSRVLKRLALAGLILRKGSRGRATAHYLNPRWTCPFGTPQPARLRAAPIPASRPADTLRLLRAISSGPCPAGTPSPRTLTAHQSAHPQPCLRLSGIPRTSQFRTSVQPSIRRATYRHKALVSP